MTPRDIFAHLGSIIASLMFVWGFFQQSFPYQLRNYIEKYSQRLMTFVCPYVQITFNEFIGERLMRSETYTVIENYLTSTSSMQAKRLKADIGRNSQSLVLSMDDHEEAANEFQGIKLWVRNRQRNLYTNNGSRWSHVVFEHPATFDTLSMEQGKKSEIVEDLITFSKAEEFYARIGRAWKRALDRKTSSKSVIVIEDIDCSLDLTGQRRKKTEKEQVQEETKDPKQRPPKDERENRTNQVTLSGLLNFIDGLWSSCGGERIIVFTTIMSKKLDPAGDSERKDG
ncbi:hypothetical protein SLEP1_g10240 [Rubroshorea leprosula]|uniref:AAA-type ATPase N-terminal domain-containing protein n=1 Tax=Rubroshorea leprosula TaxID=152421 RepID=A0AAV5I7F8_9ROSI|nr:hypothetical protein SLEP1_g10240 [Rubroshorea leprosula]